MPQPTKDRGLPSPYTHFDREAWARLAEPTTQPLTLEAVASLRGLGDRVDLREVEEVYLPMCRLLHLYVDKVSALRESTSAFLGHAGESTPFVIGIAGSVAVGKSTTARILAELLRRVPQTPRVELVTTDGFLLPNAELEARGILARKGFPESYDRRALLRFVADVKSGLPRVSAPVYSHLSYDIVPGERIVVEQPDILILEGLNVLSTPDRSADGRAIAVSDYFDFSIYVDADVENLRTWYVERFLRLREAAFADPRSYFHRYASLSDDQARRTAATIWAQTNEPNLLQNVVPSRGRATLVLHKGAEHAVTRIALRKI